MDTDNEAAESAPTDKALGKKNSEWGQAGGLRGPEISFKNEMTNQTFASEALDSTGKYASFGESFARNGQSRESGKRAPAPHALEDSFARLSLQKAHSKWKRQDSDNKENEGDANAQDGAKGLGAYAENKARLESVAEETDHLSTRTNEKQAGEGRGKAKADNSTVSSTVHSRKPNQENVFMISMSRFSGKLKHVKSKGEMGEAQAKWADRKTEARNLGQSNKVKDMLLNGSGLHETVQVFNLREEKREGRPKRRRDRSRDRAKSRERAPESGKKGDKPRAKAETRRGETEQRRRKRKRNRGQVSSQAARELTRRGPDEPCREGPQIQVEMKRRGLGGKGKSKSEAADASKVNVSRGARTEQGMFESRSMWREHLISWEGESGLGRTMDEHSLRRHNKFLKNGRKKQSNIKVNFGQSLSAKKKVIRRKRGERAEGKRLFEEMGRAGIESEVHRRMRRKSPVKIRSHDDVMKKSADFIDGRGGAGGAGDAGDARRDDPGQSLVESILKKKEVSQVSLDYMGA